MPEHQLNERDSYSPLISEITFAVGTRLIRVASHEFLQSIRIEQPSQGAWSGSIVLFDRIGDFLEDLILLAGTDRRVLFRWGWDNGKGIGQYPLYEGFITEYTPEFSPEGVTLTLNLAPSQVVVPALDKKTRPFPPGQLISAIVRQIAAERKWQHEINGRDTIEDTNGKIEKPFSQKDESDVKFIMDTLVKEAVNKNGKHFMFYFDNKNRIHFHSPDWINKQEGKVDATYTFARDMMGEVISFAPTDGKVFGALYGNAAADYTAIDSLGGNKTEIATTDQRGPEGSKNEVVRDSVFQTKLLGNKHAVVNLIARHPDELSRKAQARYSKLKDIGYAATMEVRGTHAVHPQGFVEARYFKRNNEPHYLSGVFRVFTISHDVSAGGWTSSFEMFRSGTRNPGEGGERAEKDITVDPKGREQREQKGFRRAQGSQIERTVNAAG